MLPSQVTGTQTVIAWYGFMFALLQSVCTFFTALDGLRLLIGAGALAAIFQAGTVWDHFHTNWIRVPMVVLAFAGSVLNLLILRRIWRLRTHPAAQWRTVPVSPRKIRMERFQFTLAVITLALIGIEEITHFRTFHHF
ncbi:MAG TPA: hypothetical protein VE178_14970 [Silvibacterium sp.]|nr:hypothetical protein [Silvibacterium sp.]